MPISFKPIEAPKSYGICRKCGKEGNGRLYRSIMEKELILICNDCIEKWCESE